MTLSFLIWPYLSILFSDIHPDDRGLSCAQDNTDKVLFIASECNTAIGVAHQKRQMEFFPNAELVVIQNSGHMIFGEQPVESIRIVREYLQEQ